MNDSAVSHSGIQAGLARNRAPNWAFRTMRTRDLLVYCNRGTGGAEYDELAKAFERLAGTRVRTYITTGNKRSRHGFGLVESSSIVERTKSQRIASIELSLSEWLYNLPLNLPGPPMVNLADTESPPRLNPLKAWYS